MKYKRIQQCNRTISSFSSFFWHFQSTPSRKKIYGLIFTLSNIEKKGKMGIACCQDTTIFFTKNIKLYSSVSPQIKGLPKG